VLDDGAVPELSPLELELPELDELELLDEPELLPDELPDFFAAEWLAACCVAAACVAPGSVAATPAAASTLAAPAAIVTDRSLDWWRLRAAIASCRERRGSVLGSAVIVILSRLRWSVSA